MPMRPNTSETDPAMTNKNFVMPFMYSPATVKYLLHYPYYTILPLFMSYKYRKIVSVF
ncbi:hypothetical protein GCM10009001_22100 [Virgibacillus siamensis]|uniref:Uncharacterized protein n=1 Tax=Virgibacillus siamensis TaxID=480071 RepID=A0ABP3RCE9_9BACI